MKKVLFVTTELRAGGAERCLTELACRLSTEKFETSVVSLAPLPTERGEFVERMHGRQIPVHTLGVSSRWQFPRARRRLLDVIDSTRPDVVLSFLFHANVLVGTCLKTCPFISHIANVRVADPRKWRLPIERRSLEQAERIICVSQAVKNYCRDTGRFPEDKLCVIPNGVDVTDIDDQLAEQESPAVQAELEGGPHIGFLGRLDHQKGVDRLLEAWPKLLSQFPQAQLWLAGTGPQQKRLEAQAKRLGFAEQVHWLGWSARPWTVLKPCEVMVFPSRFEGMSNALLEAMGARRAVVAFPIQGVSEVLSSGPPVQLPPNNDSSALIDHLTQLLSSKELVAQCAQFNRDRIDAEFGLERMIRRFETQIEDAI